MKKYIVLFLSLFTFVSIYADDSVLCDTILGDSRLIRSKDSSFIIHEDNSNYNNTLYLEYFETRQSKENFSRTFFLGFNVLSDQPHTIPFGTKILMKGEDGKVFEFNPYLSSLQECKQITFNSRTYYQVPFSFVVSPEEIESLIYAFIVKIRIEIPWEETYIDLEKNYDVLHFSPSSTMHELYKDIKKHLFNIYDGF